MKKIFLIALLSLVMISVGFAKTEAQGPSESPPFLVTVCNQTMTVHNLSNVSVPLTVLGPVTGYTYHAPIFGYQSLSFPIGVDQHLIVLSQSYPGFSQRVDYGTGCYIAFGGPTYYYPVPTPYYVVPPLVYYQTYTPEACVLGTYQGVLPLLPGAVPISGDVAVYSVSGPDATVGNTQIIFDPVINGEGKFDSQTRCVDRVAITSWVGPNNIVYNVSGWYKAFVNGIHIATFGMLAGRTNQVIVVWYDTARFTPDPLRHYLVLN